MKKHLPLIALAASLVLTGCGGADTSAPAGSPQTQTAEQAPKAPDLAGAWKQSNPNSPETYQQATITADTITVEWVSNGGDTRSVYWVGTFEAPTDATEPHTWSSKRDAAATDNALMASTSDTKDFTFQGDTISYDVSALGSTTTVKLKKN